MSKIPDSKPHSQRLPQSPNTEQEVQTRRVEKEAEEEVANTYFPELYKEEGVALRKRREHGFSGHFHLIITLWNQFKQ